MRVNRGTVQSVAGDTIVEVMIALSIITMVLTISFATAQRSLLTGQAAQERTEALKLAESQVETLKSLQGSVAPNVYDDLLTGSKSFCLDPTNSSVIYDQPAINNVTVLEASATPLAGSNTFDDNCNIGFDKRYFVAITRTDTARTPPRTDLSNFMVQVYWYGVTATTNNGIQQLGISYNMHQVTL